MVRKSSNWKAHPRSDLRAGKRDVSPAPLASLRMAPRKQVCGVCGTSDTNIRLACTHAFHRQCYNPSRNESKCRLCESKNRY